MVSAILLVAAAHGAVASGPGGPNPFESASTPSAGSPLDRLAWAGNANPRVAPAALCSDAVFLRRAYLDVIGTLPTGAEARDFLLDPAPDKRRALVERLLGREEFADFWAMKWGDLLRVKAEFPINLWPNAAQAYHRWIRTSLREGRSFDWFARELLTASGSNFRVGPVNFYRAMQNREPRGIAQTVALTFLGTRLEQWPEAQAAGMAAFFSQIGTKSTGEWKEEIVFFDPHLATNGLWQGATFPDGTAARFKPGQDPRAVFADWLITPENPWFTRAIANRVWSWLMGRGIIHEADDLRPDNPPANPALLAYLERELIAAKYDLRHLFRLILNSKTYQLFPIADAGRPPGEATYALYHTRRLEAEVLIDALNQITGSREKYSSPIPEPFTVIPETQRSIALPDGSITSSFLELFGRPPRDTGLESERNNRPTAAQRLHLLNSSHIQRKIEQSPMIRYQTQPGKGPGEMATGIYLGILSRFPTEGERQAVEEYAQSGVANRQQAAVDLAWALINSPEFLYRH